MFNNKYDLNFWPSFADLMLSLVLVLMIMLSVFFGAGVAGQEDLNSARNSQTKIAARIQGDLKGKWNYSVDISSDDKGEEQAGAQKSEAEVVIVNFLDRQTISFSDKILFDVNKAQLKAEGREVLNVVGEIIKDNLPKFNEIQIQGHADNTFDPRVTDKYNLELAADRAISVYEFFQHEKGITPAENLMSITSFGHYKPVGRTAGQTFNDNALQEANKDDEAKRRNRRIEILLIYKNQGASVQG